MGIALAKNRLGQRAEAEALLRDVKTSFGKSLGPAHWRTANAQYQLAVVLQERGKLEEALAEARPAQAILLSNLGPEHPRTVAATKTLGELESATRGELRTAR
jgi:hypothetical protein